MDFITAQREVGAQLGLDYQNSDQSTLIKRWLNMAYQDIVGKYDWSWLKAYTTVTMQVDYTTGTVSVNSGSATLTFSDVIATSQANRFIQLSGSTTWYQITAHVAGTATATISPVYAPSTNLTSSTFIIRTVNYSLGSNVEYIYGARSTVFPWAIEITDRTRYNQYAWWSFQVGPVRALVPNGLDASNNWTFTPYPFPNNPDIVEIYYYKRIADLSANTETPLFPARFDSVWIDGAIAYGFRFLDDTRYNDAFNKFQIKVGEMFSRDNMARNQMWILRPYDDQPAARGINFPPFYGPNTK